jgi:putative peptidoglycan lipid II flippase
MTAQTTEKRTRQLAQSTLIVMIAFGVAKLISLGQTLIITKVFGLNAPWAAFVTANRIPELIFTLIAGGALAHAFIPIFSGYLAKKDSETAWRVASHVVNTVFLVTLVVSVIVFFVTPWLVANVVAPGFNITVQQQTVELMRILLLSTLIFSVSGIVMGILQSHNHFLLPALAPIMFDIGILIGALFLLPIFGVRGIAIGAVLGASMHFAIQIPGLIRYRASWKPEFGIRDPILWKIIRLMLPRVAGLGVISLNFLVMNNIASRLGTAPVAALDWGWRLMQIPETLIGTAMGTVIFPTLAALSELSDVNGKREAMSGALRFILILTIPSAVILVLLGETAVSLLEGGAFDASASSLVYSTLRYFALGLIVHSALEIVARSFYADKDTMTPLWAAFGGAIINLVLSIILSGVTQPDFPGNVAGLALANSLGVAFEVMALLWILQRRWYGIGENILAGTLAKSLVASLVMGLAIVFVNVSWSSLGFNERGTVFTIAQLGLGLGVGAITFIGAGFLLKMDELKTLLTLLRRRRNLAEVTA